MTKGLVTNSGTVKNGKDRYERKIGAGSLVIEVSVRCTLAFLSKNVF